MTNIDLKYYIVFLNGNYIMNGEREHLDYIYCAFPLQESFKNIDYKYIKIPTLAVEVPGKDYLIDYFTHKKIKEKKDLAHSELTFTGKREATLEELKIVAKLSKIAREKTTSSFDPLFYYKDEIKNLEEFSLNEYNDYIESLDELSNIFNSPDLELRKES